jgi:hypothetical protein
VNGVDRTTRQAIPRAMTRSPERHVMTTRRGKGTARRGTPGK